VHSNGKSNLFVISVYISVYFLFWLFFRVVRSGGGYVKGARGPVRKVVHGPGPLEVHGPGLSVFRSPR